MGPGSYRPARFYRWMEITRTTSPVRRDRIHFDTGIRATHSQFGGRVTSGFTAINDGQALTTPRPWDARSGHRRRLNLRRSQERKFGCSSRLGCNGSGSNSGVIAGVDFVTSNHAAGASAVANMSFGRGCFFRIGCGRQQFNQRRSDLCDSRGNVTPTPAFLAARVANAITVGSTIPLTPALSFQISERVWIFSRPVRTLLVVEYRDTAPTRSPVLQWPLHMSPEWARFSGGKSWRLPSDSHVGDHKQRDIESCDKSRNGFTQPVTFFVLSGLHRRLQHPHRPHSNASSRERSYC